jgi:hypothetical protein
MKRFTRSIVVLAFVVANLALLATPADAGLRTRYCLSEEGEEVICCKLCLWFCDGCHLAFDDSDGNDDSNDTENN